MEHNVLSIILIALVGIAVIAIFNQGYNHYFDDVEYLNLANQMHNNTFSIISTPYAYGDFFIVTIALYPYMSQVEYLLIAFIIYFTLIKWFKPSIALTTTICVELSAFMAIYTSRIIPDMLLGLLISLVFLIYAYKRESAYWMLAAGFLSGATIFIKFGSFVLLLLLAFPISLLAILLFLAAENLYTKKLNGTRIAFIAGIFIAILLYQALLPQGTSILSLAQTYSHNQARLSWTTLGYNLITLYLLFFSVTITLAQVFPLGLLATLAIAGTLLMLYAKDRRYFFVALAFWVSVIYLFIGTETLYKYTFITVVSRYFISFAGMMAILAAYAINYLCERMQSQRNYILIGMIILTILTNLSVYTWIINHPNFNYAS